MFTLNRPPIPAEKQAAIVDAYKTGESVDSIAKRFGVGQTTVLTFARRAGLRRELPRPAIPAEKQAAIIEAYQTDESIYSIAKRFGVSPGSIKRFAGRAGRGRRSARLPIPVEKQVAVIEAYKRGESIHRIAERLAVSPRSVKKFARREELRRVIPPVSAEKQAAIIEAYHQTDESIYSIAKRFGVSPVTIRMFARRAGRGRDVYTTPNEQAAIIQAYQTNESLDSIARRFNVHMSTIRRLAERAGLKRWKIRHVGHPITTDEQAAILRDYAAQEPLAVIARRFNISQTTVVHIAYQAGLSRTKSLSASQRADIVQRYILNEPVSSIAERHNLGHDVSRIVREAGIPLRRLLLPYLYTSSVRAKLGNEFCAVARKFSVTPFVVLELARKRCSPWLRRHRNIELPPFVEPTHEKIANEACQLAEKLGVPVDTMYNFAVPLCGEHKRRYPRKGDIPPEEIERLHALFEYIHGYRPNMTNNQLAVGAGRGSPMKRRL